MSSLVSEVNRSTAAWFLSVQLSWHVVNFEGKKYGLLLLRLFQEMRNVVTLILSLEPRLASTLQMSIHDGI